MKNGCQKLLVKKSNFVRKKTTPSTNFPSLSSKVGLKYFHLVAFYSFRTRTKSILSRTFPFLKTVISLATKLFLAHFAIVSTSEKLQICELWAIFARDKIRFLINGRGAEW